MLMWRQLSILLILCSSFACMAQQPSQIAISDSYLSATFPMANSAAGYFTLTNTSDEPVVVTGISVSSTIAKGASLHETVVDDEIVSMRPLHKLTLNAGQTVRFEAGGKHIMLTGLNKPLTVKMTVDVTFLLGNRPPVSQTFQVHPAEHDKAKSQHDHH
ncbi:copper chaperone PCu(A)C [Salinimonas iocasae]|uniref:Copper chaperone PCu(A)C n=2 Tax=Salinimonas iocasae TaxID=2572577 RepID=A0A5B7YGF9_9ALTE|nr:copper chaperone PCu(A)C [Salinimonas iocasae]